MLGLIFVLIGIICAIVFVLKPLKNKRKCTVEVRATIEDVEESNVKVNGEPMYDPICKYYYRGMEYTSKISMNVRKYEIPVGNNITIKINPSDPKQIYIPATGINKMVTTFILGVCGIFIAVGTFVFVDENTEMINKFLPNEYKIGDYVDKTTESEVNGGQDVSGQKVDNQKVVDSGQNNDSEFINKLRNSENYIKVYGDDYSDSTKDIDEATVAKERLISTKSYVSKCRLVTDIEGMSFYLPKEFELLAEGQNRYTFRHSVTGSELFVYFKDNTLGLKGARQWLNDVANNNHMLVGVKNNIYSSRNMFEVCKARSVEGKYLDIICSTNEHYILYMEYFHKLGTDNIINDLANVIKY